LKHDKFTIPGLKNGTKLGVRARTGVFNKRSILLVLYAIYLAFILVSTIPYIAEHQTRYLYTNEKHTYHIVFEEDGSVEPHYFNVIRADPAEPGVLDLEYDPDLHILDVKATNIKELRIESQSIYKDEAQVIIGKPYSEDPTYYKQWFIDKNKFTITIDSKTEITSLVFENVPLPVSVLVNDKEWWKTNTNWESVGEDDIKISSVPQGLTTVIIYFQETSIPISPHAVFIVEPFVAAVDTEVLFDGTGSYDDDGEIKNYIWDFGDGSDLGTDDVVKHSYSDTGTYTVSLTVIDDDNLDNTTSKDIYIVTNNDDDDNDNVPNQLDPHPFDALDSDQDGLSDDFEDFYGGDAFTREPWPEGKDLNYLKKDTDGDGYNDGVEIELGTNPIDPADHPREEDEETEEDEGILGMGAMGYILLIVVVIIIVMIILMIVIRKRKGEKVTEVDTKDIERMVIERDRPVGPGLVKPGKREMGPGPAMGVPLGIPKKKPPEVRGPPRPPRKGKPLKPSPPVPKKPLEDKMRPPLKRLPSKPPVQSTVMLDTLELDSLKKFLPPDKIMIKPVKKEPEKPVLPKDKLPPPKSPLETKLISKPTPPKPSMESLVKPTKPPALKDQSPADYKAETIAKFAQALGIGRAKATALYNGGYTTISQLQKATKEELMEIKGIGPKMADRIIKNLEFLMAKRM
jgi:PKD repeat protein